MKVYIQHRWAIDPDRRTVRRSSAVARHLSAGEVILEMSPFIYTAV